MLEASSLPVLVASKLVNLTPHQVVLYDGDTPVLSLKGEPASPRLQEDMDQVCVIKFDDIDIPVHKITLGAVNYLPKFVPGVYLIVSRMLAERVPERTDLLVPVDMVRAPDGRILGCRGFTVVNL